MRLNFREEKAAGFFLFLGAVLIGIALGGFLYGITHRKLPPDMAFFPVWGIVLALAFTLFLVTTLRDPGFRVAFLALAVGQGLMLWKLIRSPEPTLWFVDNTVALFIGAICVSVSAKKNGRIARIVALLLSAGMLAVRYFSIENWMRALERIGHAG
jgi:hypothetical protein